MQRYQHADESELLRWVRDGDHRAFAVLVEPYRDLLHNVCYRITGNLHDAEDALQATLLAVWRNIGSFKEQSKFSTWVYRIAHNAALAVVRKRRAEPVDTSDLVIGSPDAFATDVATRDVVMTALRRLPPDFRAALVLREYLGLTYQEIAEVQDIRIETVKTRISRARQGLAHLLG